MRSPASLTARRRALAALALLLAGLGLPTVGRGRPQRPAEPWWPDGLRAEQAPAEVAKLLGAPTHTSRQVVAHRCVEQWHYGPPRSYRLTFLAFRGQRPRLQSVRPAPRPQPAP